MSQLCNLFAILQLYLRVLSNKVNLNIPFKLNGFKHIKFSTFIRKSTFQFKCLLRNETLMLFELGRFGAAPGIALVTEAIKDTKLGNCLLLRSHKLLYKTRVFLLTLYLSIFALIILCLYLSFECFFFVQY